MPPGGPSVQKENVRIKGQYDLLIFDIFVHKLKDIRLSKIKLTLIGQDDGNIEFANFKSDHDYEDSYDITLNDLGYGKCLHRNI